MHLRRSLLTLLFTVCWSGVELHAVERAAPTPATAHEVPPAIRAAMQALDKRARPVELRRARNGALYALLPNGAEIVVQEKRNAPVVCVYAFVRTGAIHEQEWLGAGLSHFCEHLMFKGTTKRPTGTLDHEIRAAGGKMNAYTTSDMTVYHTTCPASKFATGFDAVADMLMHSTFPPEEVRKEHDVVRKEIELYQDDPEEALWRGLGRLRFQVHPYRLSVLGYPDRFKRVTRQEVWAYYRRRYAPQLTAFVAVGDVAAAEAMPLMARALAKWQRTSVAMPAIPEEPPQVAPREVTVRHPLCQVPKLLLGFPSVSLRHPDRCALDVLATILGRGRSSRLYREVVDKRQLATEIGATASEGPGYELTFVVWATLQKGRTYQARAAILEVLEAARRQAVTPRELARAQRRVVAQHVFAQMTADGVADTLGTFWLTVGDLDFGQLYVDKVQKLTAKDVLRVAKEYLNPQMLNTVFLLPETKLAAGATRSKASPALSAKTLRARLAALRAQPDVAAASVLEGAKAAGAPTFEVRFKNGLRLVAREDTSLPAVHVAVTCLGGQRWEPANLEGAANLLAMMLDRGTASRTKAEIAALVESLGAALHTASGKNVFTLRLRCLKEDLERLFELATDCLLRPSFSQEELERARQEVRAKIAAQEENLFSLNFKLLRPVLYPDHPYGRERLGTVASIAKITPADLRRLHAAWARPEHLGVAFVGDCAVEKAVGLARRHLRWPRAKVPFTAPQTALRRLEGTKEAEKAVKGIEGATLTLAFRGPKLNHPDRDRLDLLSALLSGLGGRLFVAIREEQGLAYDVGSQHDPDPDGGAFILFVQTHPTKLQACLDSMWAEVKKLREKAIGPSELQEIKNYLTGQEAVAMQHHGRLARRLALAQLLGGGAERVFSRRARILRVTAKQLQEVARKYLSRDGWAKAVVKAAP